MTYRTAVFSTLAFVLTAPVSAGTLTCEQGQEAMCDEWCSHVGGGMSSNPDGSVTCTYAMMMRDDAKYDQAIINEGDWVVTLKASPDAAGDPPPEPGPDEAAD